MPERRGETADGALRLAPEVVGPGQARHERLRATREAVHGRERDQPRHRAAQQQQHAEGAAGVAGGDAVAHVHSLGDEPPERLGDGVQRVEVRHHRRRHRRGDPTVGDVGEEMQVDAEEAEAGEIGAEHEQPERRRARRRARAERDFDDRRVDRRSVGPRRRGAVGGEPVVLGAPAHHRGRGEAEDEHHTAQHEPGRPPSEPLDQQRDRDRHHDAGRGETHGGDGQRTTATAHEPARDGGVAAQIAERDAAERHHDPVAEHDVPGAARGREHDGAAAEAEHAERHDQPRPVAIDERANQRRERRGHQPRRRRDGGQEPAAQVQGLGHEWEEHAERDGEDAIGEQVGDEGAGDDPPAVEHGAIVASFVDLG